MSVYLDRLTDEFEAITAGIDDTLNRAAEESRELTSDESQLVERDQSRAEELRTSIEHYGKIEETRSKVDAVRARVPSQPVQRSTRKAEESEYKLEDDFKSVGEYISVVSRSLGGHGVDAKIERATAHQMLADNPGIVPRPILAPVINLIDASRPFIQSIGTKALPAGSFDRPIITQHVAVGKQAVEKDLTQSQQLLLGKLAVAAQTYAGHLNISRQDIKWTQPGILQIVAEDFAAIYADETDADAVAQFIASLTGAPVTIPAWDAESVTAALFQGAAASLQAKAGFPDKVWVSLDVWGALGSLTTPNGGQLFPSLSPGSNAGNVLGLQVVPDWHFPAKTMVEGGSRRLEWYEDVDGLISVQEPNVLGQLVGYAGYGAFLNTAPTAFTSFAPDVPDLPEADSSRKGSSKAAA